MTQGNPSEEAGKKAGAWRTSGPGLSHLAGTTFMEKLQVPWRLVFQPLQPLGRQSLSKSWQSAGDRSQRPLLG